MNMLKYLLTSRILAVIRSSVNKFPAILGGSVSKGYRLDMIDIDRQLIRSFRSHKNA